MRINDILERIGLKFEELNVDERETLNSWMSQLQGNKLVIEDVKKYIHSMKESVEQELTTSDIKSKKDLFLKARLRNYVLLESFMTSPEKAQQALEKQLAGLVNKKN